MTTNIDIAKQEMHRLSAELHDGKIAPNSSEYRHFSQCGILVGVIYKVYPRWPAFCAACGLQLASNSYYYAAAKARGSSVAAAQREAIPSEDRRIAAAIASTNGLFRDGQAEALTPAGIPCTPWQTKRIFDWRTYRYITVESAVLL